MKSMLGLRRVLLPGIAALVLGCALGLAVPPSGQPLSQDDITLLLLGSSPSSKIIQMVEQRGVDFSMTPDLAKKFHDQGASDDLIEALQKARTKAAESKSGVAPAAAPSPAPPVAEAAPSAPPPGAMPSSTEPVLHTHGGSAPAATPASSAASAAASAPADVGPSTEPVLHTPPKADAPVATTASANAPGLKDPDAQGIQHIIQEFAAKEKVFREARNNYTYHQINKVQELGPENQVVGTYEQEWDILYDDAGKRIEKVTYAPLNTLKGLIVTKEDLEGFRNVQPFVLTTDELPEYEINYLGHVKVDEITAFVFRIRPKQMEKDKQYFQGEVWVDDRDLQIVKSEGRQVPEAKVHHGQENLFPRFTTWREQIDGKFWFPTYTMADDTLYFSNGPPVHMKEIIRYTDYKQFKSGVRILTVESLDKQKDQNSSPPPKK